MPPKMSLKKERAQIKIDKDISKIRAIEKRKKQVSLADIFKINRTAESSI